MALRVSILFALLASPDDNLSLKLDPGVLVYSSANQVQQCQNIIGACARLGHDEVRVLGTDGRPADRLALESGFVNELPRRNALLGFRIDGVLERTTCGRSRQRLRTFLEREDLFHAITQRHGVGGLEVERGRNDHRVGQGGNGF